MNTAIKKLNETAKKIKKMEIRGALDIAIAAAESLLHVVNSDADDIKNTGDLISTLKICGEKLKSARPSAVSLPNAVNYIIYLADDLAGNLTDDPVDKNMNLENSGIIITECGEFREKLSVKIRDFIGQQKKAIDTIAEIGARLIEDGDVILTHCNSDTVVGVLKAAWDCGKKIEVVCTETRPRKQGYLTARELSEHGIPTTLIVDSAAHLAMKKLDVDKLTVGADTICADGDLINKIGTSQIAICAHEMNIPLLVATESIKFSPETVMGAVVQIEERNPDEVIDPKKLKNVRVMNPAFDVTDSRYIDVIITEYGVMPPQAAYNILREKFGWKLGV